MAEVRGQALLWIGYWQGCKRWHVHTFQVEGDQLVIRPRDDESAGETLTLDLATCVIEGTDDLRFTIKSGEQTYHFQAGSEDERQRLVVSLSSAKIFSKSLIDAQTMPEQGGGDDEAAEEEEQDATVDTEQLRAQIKGIVDNLQRYVRATEQTLANFKLPAKAAVKASELHYNFNCIMQSCEDLNSALAVVSDVSIAGVAVRDERRRFLHPTPQKHQHQHQQPQQQQQQVEAAHVQAAAATNGHSQVVTAGEDSPAGKVEGEGEGEGNNATMVTGDNGEHAEESRAPDAQQQNTPASTAMAEDGQPTPEHTQQQQHANDDNNNNKATFATLAEEPTALAKAEAGESAAVTTTTFDADAPATSTTLMQESKEEGEEEDEEEDDNATFFRTVSPSFSQFANHAPGAGAVDTRTFLDAAREMLPLIAQLGTTMTPVKSDILGNIKKLERAYEQDPQGRATLDLLIQHEIDAGTTTAKDAATDALLWLRRALEFIEHFLLMVSEGEDNLAKAAGHAYEISLRKHHNWMIRQVFGLAMRSLPEYRTFMDFLGSAEDEQKLRDMQAYALGVRNARLSVTVPEP
ncbi:hypothetical protein PTSG_07397 [Salpingoeca rosetta]|uniref:Glycolipid transfer protein domain-containing protein n=1 Tax=Salpingoeca rosetta (strain ATCC 50818 / BSB-021) TaxID=946362 RepID=F2UIK8_SALR5|nr:uncharacterized protein PTSG_07397 [Salpingoeca rosetta]EGD77057.1 hypothetical protein PTSG_07397 [Salpingoeca rosetta]|eukprot:XP_004990897.1 hypothetical protein PTSG_07397 [Salpingoeca rosetta]